MKTDEINNCPQVGNLRTVVSCVLTKRVRTHDLEVILIVIIRGEKWALFHVAILHSIECSRHDEIAEKKLQRGMAPSSI